MVVPFLRGITAGLVVYSLSLAATTTAPAGNAAKRQALFTGTPPPATQPEWADAIKNPVPWLKWGADMRLRWEYVDNALALDRQKPNNEWNFQRYRTRFWTTVTPAPFLDLNVRMAWEGRHWCDPQTQPDWDNKEVLFDNLNAKIRVPDLPVTVTVGRQDIILGEGWLVLEGTPLDGSRSIYFDAVRTTIDLKPAKTTVDLIYIDQYAEADRWLPVMAHRDEGMQIEQDERGAIVQVSNKSIARTQLDGYFIYKQNRQVLGNGDQGEVYTFGGRTAVDITEHWKARSEGAYQFGRRNDAQLSASGSTNRLCYAFNDKWKNQLKLNYEYLSGDDPDNERNTAFDPLWGRWPQWSELLIYTQATETRVSEWTNLQRLAFGWQADPTDKLTILADYHLLFANENTYEGRAGFSDAHSFRGQLITTILKYKFNRFLSGHLWGEYFCPGNYYESPRDDPAAYLRAELVFAF